MSEELFVKYCSPTLAGIKTGSLFSAKYSSEEELDRFIRDINERLIKKGLRVVPLKKDGGIALIYAYRPSKLRFDLGEKQAREILEESGYESLDPDALLSALKRRINGGGDFPHEIGLFLGYPPEDVKGFIDNKAKNFKRSGIWKVYGDEKRSDALFSKYRKCADVYLKKYREGNTLERLTVFSAT